MPIENETIIIDLHGEFQRRLRSVNQDFAPLASDDDQEEEPAPVELAPAPRPAPVLPPASGAREIAGFRLQLPPTKRNPESQ
ncbi:MAG: hypothetical protein ACI8W8_002531 [Rhodothermales bacterium]|jgi:hypothetical protein